MRRFLQTARTIASHTLHAGSRLAGNRSGNIAMMFALLSVPLIGTVGLSVDYSRLLALRSVAQGAADSAALFAVKVAKEEMNSVKGASYLQASILAETKARAQQMFAAAVKEATGDGQINATVSLVRVGSQFKATVNYNVAINATFSRVVGQEKLWASNLATAISSMPLFSDISLLLDISQSMGIAATEADAKTLFAATKAFGKEGCVFGCHVSAPSFGSATPFDQVAANVGVKLRIDVLRDATKNMIQNAKLSTGDNSFYRFGLYTMSYDFKTVAPISANLTSAYAKASAVTLGYNDTSGFGDSNYTTNVKKLLPYVLANGDGLSSSTAKQYVFIVTDGVRDVYGSSCASTHCTAPFDPVECKAFKDRGAVVGVIYTTYLPVMKNPLDPISTELQNDYKNLVFPFATQIPTNLKSCASDGWYFEASDDVSIHAAMEKMFTQIELPPTVTQ